LAWLLLSKNSRAHKGYGGGSVLAARLHFPDDLRRALVRCAGGVRNSHGEEVVTVRQRLQELMVPAVVVDFYCKPVDRQGYARFNQPRGAVAVRLDFVFESAQLALGLCVSRNREDSAV